ncbi:hypothetical protein [uncultured Amnibacterium sp.]|uniref:hypothetical protein n=1 Tax=uncultured Amnibacterium sp. TaxID=1631851 RepID=UPI0035CA55F7
MDADRLYQALVLRARPHTEDPYRLVDAMMPTLLAALEQVWNDGRDTGLLTGWGPQLAGNPYGADLYPDWPRRRITD